MILNIRVGGIMPSRMERYYQSEESDIKKRSTKNQDLYRKIYEEGEYTNVEGISILPKNEKIDIEKIRELIGTPRTETKPKEVVKPIETITPEPEQEKNYDIRDILEQAKSERSEKDKRFENTQYNVLKNINLKEEVPDTSIETHDLKDMIEAITTNSKIGATSDLLDDLKTIHDQNMIKEFENVENQEIDRSFYTSSLGFTSDDFEDLKEMKDSLKTNNRLTKVLLFILLVVIVTSVTLLVMHFMK